MVGVLFLSWFGGVDWGDWLLLGGVGSWCLFFELYCLGEILVWFFGVVFDLLFFMVLVLR
jgi:hypothetical protein